MINTKDYIFGFTTAFLMLMMLSASPAPQTDHRAPEMIEQQKKLISEQKDCIRKIQSKQRAIVDELSKIKILIKQTIN
jgi:hypothetical protein